MFSSALGANGTLLGKNDPLLSHHPIENVGGRGQENEGEPRERFCFDAEAFGDIVAGALGVGEMAWTIARAQEFLMARRIHTGWEITDKVIIIERRALVQLSPNSIAVIAARAEIRMISVGAVATGGARKLRGAPTILTLLIAVSDNVEELVEGEIARFVASSTVDISIGLASSGITGMGIQIAALATGQAVLLPLTIGVTLGVLAGEAGEHLANRYRIRQRLTALLRDIINEAEKNSTENVREIERSRKQISRALNDPMAAIDLLQAVFLGR